MDMNEAQGLLENQEQPNQTGQPEATPQPEETSFTGIDPDALPPELGHVYKNMQADYTRKTQELAAQRKAYEGLGDVDPEYATQAVQFVSRLSSDANFGKEIYEALAQEFGTQVADEITAPNQEATTEFGAGEEQQQPSENDKALQELLTWKEQQEEQQQLFEITNNIERQEMAIRQAHPEYTDTDVDYLYNLAFAHGGDLEAASSSYETMKQDLVGRYLDSKRQVPATPPQPTEYGQQPQKFENLDDASRAAIEYLRNAQARQT